jgi:hypothetical protein
MGEIQGMIFIKRGRPQTPAPKDEPKGFWRGFLKDTAAWARKLGRYLWSKNEAVTDVILWCEEWLGILLLVGIALALACWVLYGVIEILVKAVEYLVLIIAVVFFGFLGWLKSLFSAGSSSAYDRGYNDGYDDRASDGRD